MIDLRDKDGPTLPAIRDAIQGRDYLDLSVLLTREQFDELPLLFNGFTDWRYVRAGRPHIEFHGIRAYFA